jgi:hypothetical protein
MATRFSNESTGENTGEFGDSQAQTRGSRRTIQSRRKRGLLIAATVASLIAPSTGCMFISGAQRALSRHDALDEFMVDYRNRAWAARAWLCRKNRYANHCYLSDLEAGFRQGYEDVAAGGSGCLPAVCPQSYWGWQYQSADGQARMNAWFEGYPLGVQAAEQDGVGHWGNVAAAFPSQPPAPVPAATPTMTAEGAAAADVATEELAPPIAESAPLDAPAPSLALPPDLSIPVEAVAPLQLPGL